MRALVLSDRNVAYGGEVPLVVLPGLDGEFSVLDFHQPFLYRLRKGIIKMKHSEEDMEIIPISDGLARFEGNSLLILCSK